MKKKTIVKISLDVAMLAVLVTLFSKNVISMAFHEIAGLAIIGVFVIHKLLNADWIVRVTKGFGKKTTNNRTRFLYVIDCLLVLAFLTIGVSGVFISHVVFAAPRDETQIEMPAETDALSEEASAETGDQARKSGGGQSIWKVLHYFASALVIVLLGIHMGLHARYMTGLLGKIIPFAAPVKRALSIALIALVVGFGCYQLATSSFARWISMPFSSSVGGGEMKERAMQGERAEGESMREMSDAREQPAFSVLDLLNVVATYFSMIFVFAAATAWIEKWIRRGKPRPASA